MKIAIFSDTCFPQVNGVARVVSTSAVALRNRGHEVRVFDVRCTWSFPSLIYSGERIAIPTGRILKDLELFKPDIIHTHTPFGVGREAVNSARKLGIPLVGTHHTFFDQYLKHMQLDFSYIRKLSWKYVINYYNNCDVVLSPSKALYDEMKSHGLKKKILTFPNAVNTDFFDQVTIEQKNKLKKDFDIKGLSLVYMGRLSYEKSVNQVLETFNLLLKKYPALALMIIGDGPERKTLIALCHKLGIYNNVRFTGMLYGQDLVRGLSANDLFITASKTENMPLSVLEALLVGLPAIGVKSLGMPEIIIDGVNGYTVSPDSPIEMMQAIDTLLSDDDLRLKITSMSRKSALKYGVEENAMNLETIYQSLLS